MRIIHVNAKNIEAFAQECLGKDSSVVPITPWRAKSQCANPCVHPEDILLIIALGENEEISGYMGILPFQYPQKEGSRVYWNTCWWTKPGEGARVSMSLLYEFLKLTDNRVMFSDLSEKTALLFKSMNGYRHYSREGCLIRFRSGLDKRIKFNRSDSVVASAARIIQKTGLLKAVDSMKNTYFNSLIYKNINLELKDVISFETSQYPDEDGLEFIKKYAKKNAVTIPDRAILNWWNDSGWLAKPSIKFKKLNKKYYFSSFADGFSIYWLSVKSGDEIIGTACLSDRDGIIKTPYLFYRDKWKEDFFKFLSYYIVNQKQAHSILSFHTEFSSFLKKENYIPGNCETVRRYTAVSDSITEFQQMEPVFQDGDGDAIFT